MYGRTNRKKFELFEPNIEIENWFIAKHTCTHVNSNAKENLFLKAIKYGIFLRVKIFRISNLI